MLIGLSGTGPRTSIFHVWHTSFVNFFAINHVLWSHDDVIFHLNLSARNRIFVYIRHFQQIGLTAAKIEEKRFRFLKKRRFRHRRCCQCFSSLIAALQLRSLSLSHHENKMKLRQDSPVFTILIISTKAAGRTWAFTRTPAEIRASNSLVSNSAILCSVRGVQTNLLYTPFFSATFSISCEISKASIFV